MDTRAIHIDGKKVLAKRSKGMKAREEELPAELFSFRLKVGAVNAHKKNKPMYYMVKSKGTPAMVISRVQIIDEDKKDSSSHILSVKTTSGSPFRTEWTSLVTSDGDATGDIAEDAVIKTSIDSEKAAVDQLTEKVSRLDRDHAAMKTEHEQLQSAYSQKLQAFTKLQNVQSEVQLKHHKIESQLQQDQLSFSILVDKLNNTQAEKQKLFQEASEKQTLVNELNKNIATLQQGLAGLESQQHELTMKQSVLQEVINSSASRLHDTHSSMATAEKSLAAEKRKLTDTEQKITSLQQLHTDIKERQVACEKHQHALVLQISETSKEYKQQLFERENCIVLAIASASENLETTNLEHLRNEQEKLIADKQAFRQIEQQLTQPMHWCFECLFMLLSFLNWILIGYDFLTAQPCLQGQLTRVKVQRNCLK